MTQAVVIGAGVGGLAAAVDLAARGLDVTVLERAAAPGGKMRQVAIGDARIDSGPTVFTMRWVFDALLADAGTSLEGELSVERADVLARHAWDETARLDLFADVERSAEAIGAFAGAAEARRFRAFCARAAEIYRTLERPFMSAQRPNPVELVRRAGLGGLGGLMRIKPFGTLWQELGGFFHDARLRQLFGRYATYCGSSPFLAPATLMLIAHVEQDGVWRVGGGMHAVARALQGVAERRGAVFRFGADVAEIAVGRE
ncbi:MAG: NAD(P)-binding protein, partial [Gammaproteobacteria bacterium]|nr:NAD(P)-binding protein [Gammaproteobacteria bacterium]